MMRNLHVELVMTYRSMEILALVTGNGNLSYRLYLQVHYFHQSLLAENYYCLTGFYTTTIIAQLSSDLAVFYLSQGLDLLFRIIPLLPHQMMKLPGYALNSKAIAYPNSILTFQNFNLQKLSQ